VEITRLIHINNSDDTIIEPLTTSTLVLYSRDNATSDSRDKPTSVTAGLFINTELNRRHNSSSREQAPDLDLPRHGITENKIIDSRRTETL
jgi:hypothetical protein